jgi:DNA-directed RNA polymerase subunit M/transcription elongation factor TFIIS
MNTYSRDYYIKNEHSIETRRNVLKAHQESAITFCPRCNMQITHFISYGKVADGKQEKFYRCMRCKNVQESYILI